MNAQFAKLKDTTWGVKVLDVVDEANEGALRRQPGDCVTITKRDGTTKEVTLGELVVVFPDGNAVFRIADDSRSAGAAEVDDKLTPITEIGAFEFGGEAFIVKRTKDGERLYAMKVVEINADRINEADGIVQIELEYTKGAMAFLREEHRLDAERAKELSIRYGKCIVCGRKLKAAKSVEEGMGPVCSGRVKARVAA